MKNPQDGPARNRRFFVLLLLVLCLLFFASYTQRLLRRGQVQSEVILWEERVASAELQQEQLRGELNYQTSPEYVDVIAREVLGLGRQGDKVIVVIEVTPEAPAVAPAEGEESGAASGFSLEESSSASPDILPNTAPNPAPNAGPVWKQWYELFTP